MGHALAAKGQVRRAPSTRVLAQAEEMHRALGHENLGFLSERRGFMPLDEPETCLPREFEVWDEVAIELPRSYGALSLRKTLDALPNLVGLVPLLPERSLLRACNLLAILSHAYRYVETKAPPGLPLALSQPWAAVRERLGRPDATLSYIELIVYNFRLLDAQHPDPFRVENMRLLTPTVDTD